MDDRNIAFCCKTLGDETRLKILGMLQQGTLCACKILESFDLTQPTLSYHMKMLCGSGLVKVEKIGVWNHYSVNKEVLSVLIDKLQNGACCNSLFKGVNGRACDDKQTQD